MCESTNQVRLTAQVVALDPLRYTPAGIPLLRLQLAHDGQLVDHGQPRKLSFGISAVASGPLAQRLADTQAGQCMHFTGYLAAQALGSKYLVLHIQQAQLAN